MTVPDFAALVSTKEGLENDSLKDLILMPVNDGRE